MPGAIHLPFYAVWTRNDEIKASPKDRVVVYCEHGPACGVGKVRTLDPWGSKTFVYLGGPHVRLERTEPAYGKMKWVDRSSGVFHMSS